MKIYTKTGDGGTTGLVGGSRIVKSSLRVEVYGTVDELNSAIGAAIAFEIPERLRNTFVKLNNILFVLGSDLASPLNDLRNSGTRRISANEVSWLEGMIDEYTSDLPPLRNFILPGGTKCAALIHYARTVCRRAERLAVKLMSEEDIGDSVLKFLNRLSDFLYTAARMANFLEGNSDVLWDKDV